MQCINILFFDNGLKFYEILNINYVVRGFFVYFELLMDFL